MNAKEILKDLGARTNGDVYLGVVGPVRTGKSTLIKRFMELAVIPKVEDEYSKARMIDELPQSGQGKTIMTMEPKFIPSSAATVKVDDTVSVKIRFVDCVGYVIKEAKGYEDEDGLRMVRTPWLEEPIPFDEAAKIGTQKVIQEHSSIGVVVTTDGTICEIARPAYHDAEVAVIDELKKIGKPFIVIVNSKDPNGALAIQTVEEIKTAYDAPVFACDVDHLNNDDVTRILKESLYEFPVANINLSMPQWVVVLDDNHWLKQSIHVTVEDSMRSAKRIRDVEHMGEPMKQNEYIVKYELTDVDLATGSVTANIDVKDGLYDQVLKEILGFEITDQSELLALLQDYRKLKIDYDTLSPALMMAKQTGYGYTIPCVNDIVLDKPIQLKQSGRYGVKVKARVPSWHIIRVDIDTAFEPILGGKEQGESLYQSMLADYEKDPKILFDSQLFGRKMGDILQDGVTAKLAMLPDGTKMRVQHVVKTLANRGRGNLIAIIL